MTTLEQAFMSDITETDIYIRHHWNRRHELKVELQQRCPGHALQAQLLSSLSTHVHMHMHTCNKGLDKLTMLPLPLMRRPVEEYFTREL